MSTAAAPRGAGRKQLVIEVAPLDAESEEELEDIETPEHARQARWQRVVQAAVKQSLRRTLWPLQTFLFPAACSAVAPALSPMTGVALTGKCICVVCGS